MSMSRQREADFWHPTRRFRHTAQFLRWRPDRDPRSCTYDQLEEAIGYDLADVLATPAT